MTFQKKPGVAIWTTAALLAVLVGYPLSFGPALWFVVRGDLHRKVVEWAYWPALYALPPPQIRWFGEIWMPSGAHVTLQVRAPDGDGYGIPFFGR